MWKTTSLLPAKNQKPPLGNFLKTIWISRSRLRSSVEAFSDDHIQLLVKSRNSLGSRAIFIEFR